MDSDRRSRCIRSIQRGITQKSSPSPKKTKSLARPNLSLDRGLGQRKLLRTSPPSGRSKPRNLSTTVVEAYLEWCLKQESPPRSGELARKLGLSRHAFAEAFRAVSDDPPAKYLKRRQIALARYLLETSTLTATAIAYKTGFGTRRTFFRVFADYVGATPGRCRRERRSVAIANRMSLDPRAIEVVSSSPQERVTGHDASIRTPSSHSLLLPPGRHRTPARRGRVVPDVDTMARHPPGR